MLPHLMLATLLALGLGSAAAQQTPATAPPPASATPAPSAASPKAVSGGIQSANIFQIAQQYLIVGWGGMFPMFGWTPAFAAGHTPRFPVEMPPPPDPSKRAAILTDADKKTTAASTIRPRERGRQGRRGRRR